MSGASGAVERRGRIFALVYGLAVHALFLVGVGAMAVALHGEMEVGRGGGRGGGALAANALLLLQFPLLHSLMLGRGQRWLTQVLPFGLGRDLATTTYAGFASLQLALTFGLWSPSHAVLWEPTGVLGVAWNIAYGMSWLLLGKAMFDARLSIQTGFLGWSSVVRGVSPQYGSFPDHGLFRVCRQPVYVAFAVILWSGPVWTPDHLMIALTWTVYCLVGPRFKERRYLRWYGGAFERYRERVPYWLPLPRRRAA